MCLWFHHFGLLPEFGRGVGRLVWGKTSEEEKVLQEVVWVIVPKTVYLVSRSTVSKQGESIHKMYNNSFT